MQHGSSNSDAAQRAQDAREAREAETGRIEFGPIACVTCSSLITSFDDHGWTHHLCPVCDRATLRSLEKERAWMIAEEKRARSGR